MAIKKISANLLGSNAVLAANIAGGAISAADIADNSITAAKISASTSPTFGGLTVDGDVAIASDLPTITLTDNNNSSSRADIEYNFGYLTLDADANAVDAAEGIHLKIGGTTHFALATGGDISFYEDTGTTAKFFWDASAESLGIGTDNPATLLDVSGTTPTITISDSQNKSWTSSDTIYGKVSFKTLDGSGIGAHETAYVGVHADIASSTTPAGRLVFGTSNSNAAAAETMTLDGNGFLGLGTSNPSALLTMTGNSDTSDESCMIILNDEDTDVGSQVPAIQFRGNDSNIGRIRANGSLGLILSGSSAQGDDLVVQSNTVMVGTTESNPTSSGVNTAGLSFSTTGGIRSTVASNPAATFNRKTDNGSVVIIRKDGNTLGVLGTEGGDAFYVGSGDTGLKFSDGANAIQPFNTNTEAATSNTIDLGTSGAVFSNLWLEKINISGNSNDEGIYFNSNHRIYGGSNRAFEASTSSGGSVQLGEGYTTGDVFISAPTLLYPATQAYKSDTGIQRYTKTVTVGESATTVLTVTKTSYLYGIAGTITIILFDTASPWGIYMRKFTIAGRKSTNQAGDNMGYTTGTPENIEQMDYTPTFADSDSRTSGQNGGTITFTVANGSGKGSSGGKIIFDGYISGATLS